MSNKEQLQSNNDVLQVLRDILNNGTTYEEIINQVGKESEFSPGCYYRVVEDGELEWINPPLDDGALYRTTKRFLGKPVYCGLYWGREIITPNSSLTLALPYNLTILDYVRANTSYGPIDVSNIKFNYGSDRITITVSNPYDGSSHIVIYFEGRCLNSEVD